MNNCECNLHIKDQDQKIENLKKKLEETNMLVEEHGSVNHAMKEELNRHRTFREEVSATVNKNTTFVTIIITLISIFFTLATTLITFIVQSKHEILIEDIWLTIAIIAAVIFILLFISLVGFWWINRSWYSKSKTY